MAVNPPRYVLVRPLTDRAGTVSVLVIRFPRSWPTITEIQLKFER
jgi:hypothetical protein